MNDFADYKRIEGTYRDAINGLRQSIQEGEEQVNELIAQTVADLDRIESDLLVKVSDLRSRIAEMRSIILSSGDTHGLLTTGKGLPPRTIQEKILFCLSGFPIGQEILHRELVAKILETFPEINQLSLATPLRVLVSTGHLSNPRKGIYIIPSRP
jgi:hypothetical protein